MVKESYSQMIEGILKNRFLLLIISILSFMILSPLFQGFVGICLLLDVFLTAIFISAIYAISHKRHFSLIGVLLALPMLIAVWSSYFVKSLPLIVLGSCCGILFFAFAALNILSFIFRQDEVTFNVINGAVVVYLLVAVMWAFLFRLIETLQPGSFAIESSVVQESRLLFFYYSFVTITTLGYGDVTPVTDVARSFAFLEAVVGQIYLVVLVARLVGIHISQSIERKSR